MMREVCFLRGCPGPSPHFQFAACAHSAPPRVMVYEHLDVLVSVCRCLSLCRGHPGRWRLQVGGRPVHSTCAPAFPVAGLGPGLARSRKLFGAASAPGPFAPRIRQSGAGTVASGPFHLHSAVWPSCGPSVRWRCPAVAWCLAGSREAGRDRVSTRIIVRSSAPVPWAGRVPHGHLWSPGQPEQSTRSGSVRGQDGQWVALNRVPSVTSAGGLV